MIALILTLFIQPVHAGWLKDTCSKFFLGEDYYPFADEETKALLSFYADTKDKDALYELVDRYRAGLLSNEETATFWRVTRLEL